MRLSRVLLNILLPTCSLLSFSCGAPGEQCQPTGIACAKGSLTVQACCTSSQCNYVVGASAADAGPVADKVFPCNGTNCQVAQNSVWNYCGQQCQTIGSCAKTGDTIQACCTTQCNVVVGNTDAGPPTSYPCSGTDCQAAQKQATDYCASPTP
jgi:hypothetical protein